MGLNWSSGYQPANTDKARLDRAKIQAAASQAVARKGAARQALESGAASNKPMSEAMQVRCGVVGNIIKCLPTIV